MMATDATTGFEPLRKSIEVALAPADAFELFTSGIATWWPLTSHSVSAERAVRCEVEARSGGRIYEVRDDGETFTWGTVLEWESPDRLVFTWHPGRLSDTAQEVEVRFRPAQRGTRVELEHRGWSKFGDQAAQARAEYDTGWDFVFGARYGDACRRAASAMR